MLFRGEYEFLSNFKPCKLVIKNKTFTSVEQAFQYYKASDKESRLAIMSSKSPAEAKKLGRNCKMRSDWNEIKLKVMYKLVLEKFKQNPELKNKLILIDIPIVEDNYWKDNYWGVCNGVGENYLGKILMKVRKELTTNEE